MGQQQHEPRQQEYLGKEGFDHFDGSSINVGMERAILIRKREPDTPVPSWRLHLETCAFDDGRKGTVPAGLGRGTPVSARTLAAALWELRQTPNFCSTIEKASTSSRLEQCIAHHTISAPQQIVLPGIPSISNLSPKSARSVSHRKSTKMESQRQPVRISKIPPNQETKTTFLEELRDYGEVSKILDHIQNLAERNTSSTKLAAALQTELEHAYAQIQELERAHKAVRKEMDKLLRKLAEERAIRRTMEKEKIESAMQNLQEEVKGERKSKHQLEITNSRLRRQLGEANMALSRALQDLERERKTREVLEDVCNDFTRKVGHDKSKLKLASGRVKEVEQQQKILQMASMWRKERVQMKLAEALQLQEKNVAIDRCRGELEEFMCTRRDVKGVLDSSDSFGPIHMSVRRNSSYEPWEMNKSGSIVDNLHSMNLNKGVHISKEDAYGAGYHSDSHEAESLREGSLNGCTGMEKEHKVKSRRSRLKDRARMLETLKRMGNCGEIFKDAVNSNHDIVWEFESDMEGKKTVETLLDGETREEMLKSSTLHASIGKRMEKQNNDNFHDFFNLKIEDHKKDPPSNKSLFSEHSQGNGLMSLGWEKDAEHVHTKSTATKPNSVASEVRSPHGEFQSQLQKTDFQTSFLDGQCSIPTLVSGSSPHDLIPEPPRNLRKHFAKGFKGLVEWRKHNKLGSSRGKFLAKD